jgi:hypothetical protein
MPLAFLLSRCAAVAPAARSRLSVQWFANQEALSVDSKQNRRPWWQTMLTDPQWWVPVLVLAAGLVVLRWIR